MTCINLLALNNALYCSHLELKLRLLEMAVTAALSDLRDTTQSPENAAQLIRWIYDLTVLDPNSDHTKKASPKVRLFRIFIVENVNCSFLVRMMHFLYFEEIKVNFLIASNFPPL